MTAITVCTDAPGSEEWLAERNNGIGASEIATLLGLNPYSTPVDLWLTKTGQTPPFTGNYASRRGQHMESFILDTFGDEHPGMVIETAPDDIPSIMAHPDVTAARCSLDGLGHDRDGTYVLEVKTANSRQSGLWSDGDMPDAYKAQVAYQLAVTGLDSAYVIADLAGEYTERIVQADAEFTTYVLELVDDWWFQHLDPNGPRTAPEPDPVRDRDILARLWTPDVTLDPVTLDADLVQRLRDAKAALNAAKTDWEIAAAAVQAEMREAVAAVDAAGDPVCAWSPVKARTTVDTARLKADGLFDTYSMSGQPGRSFRVKF
jgi:putative phage-type endonuclease